MSARSASAAPADLRTAGERTPVVGYVLLCSGAICISFAPVFVALSGADAVGAAFWRLTWAAPFVALLCLARPATRRDLRAIGTARVGLAAAAAAGVFFAIDLITWHVSLLRIGAGPSTLLANTQVLWLAAFAWLWLGERPSRAFGLVLPVVLAGLWLLSGGLSPDSGDLFGVAMGAIAGLAYAATLLSLRAARGQGLRAEVALFVEIAAGIPVLAGAGILAGSFAEALTLRAHLWLVALGLVSQTLGWWCIAAALPRLPGRHAGLLLLVQPSATFVWGYLILGQTLDPGRAAGAALLLAAVAAGIAAETRPATRFRS